MNLSMPMFDSLSKSKIHDLLLDAEQQRLKSTIERAAPSIKDISLSTIGSLFVQLGQSLISKGSVKGSPQHMTPSLKTRELMICNGTSSSVRIVVQGPPRLGSLSDQLETPYKSESCCIEIRR